MQITYEAPLFNRLQDIEKLHDSLKSMHDFEIYKSLISEGKMIATGPVKSNQN